MSHPRNLMSCAALSPVGDDEGAPAGASRWITFPDPEGLIAFEHAAQPGTLKVLVAREA